MDGTLSAPGHHLKQPHLWKHTLMELDNLQTAAQDNSYLKETMSFITRTAKYILTSDESEPSWLKPGLELNNFQLGSAHDLFHSAQKFPY